MVDKLEISIEIIAHATESLDKILDAFVEFFDLEETEFSKQEVSGHFDNPIFLVLAKISKKEARKFIENFRSKIPRDSMDILIEGLSERIEGSTLHLRIGKQDLIRGKISFEDKDAIKLKIFTPSYNKKDIVKNYVLLLKNAE